MKVAIVSGPRSAQPMGLESAERRLLDALRARPDGTELDLRVVGGRSARRHARSIGARWHPARSGRVARTAWWSADLVHLIGLDVPPPRSGPPFIATVHDLAALRFSDEGRLPDWVEEIAARAARLVTPSRFTAGELEQLMDVPPERISVIPNGPGQPVAPATAPMGTGQLAALGLQTPFVLRMGGYTERKNVPRLLAAWPEVRRRTGASLALVGPPQAARQAQLAAAPLLDGVVVIDYVPAELVPGLIRAAEVLASPSTYEGFGLPPLEAMRAGTPVVAIRAGSTEEVCGDAAVLVDDDSGTLASALIAVLEDGDLRGRLAAAGERRAAAFSWDEAAARLVSVYRAIGNGSAG